MRTSIVGNQRLHVALVGDESHPPDIGLNFLVVEVEGVFLVEDGLDVLCVLAEDDGI